MHEQWDRLCIGGTLRIKGGDFLVATWWGGEKAEMSLQTASARCCSRPRCFAYVLLVSPVAPRLRQVVSVRGGTE